MNIKHHHKTPLKTVINDSSFGIKPHFFAKKLLNQSIMGNVIILKNSIMAK